ncbi:MAG: DeoR/GlpR family DNA-binding transcription regulator [Pseudomonadota bacterium]
MPWLTPVSKAVICRILQKYAEWRINLQMIDLNNPQTRQNLLRERLDAGAPLVVSDLAAELSISIDTVRRDLIALERQGFVRRVRGGAIPVSSTMPTYLDRANAPDPKVVPLGEPASRLLPETGTVFIDAGTTMNVVAASLPLEFQGLIVTPAPSVALAALHRGARVHLIGGALCPEGAMTTGGAAEQAVSQIAADLCFLGACGLWPAFGLGAEDALEAGVKRAMALMSDKVVVVATAAKLQRRGRHKVLGLDEIDCLVTDATPPDTAELRNEGVEVIHV